MYTVILTVSNKHNKNEYINKQTIKQKQRYNIVCTKPHTLKPQIIDISSTELKNRLTSNEWPPSHQSKTNLQGSAKGPHSLTYKKSQMIFQKDKCTYRHNEKGVYGPRDNKRCYPHDWNTATTIYQENNPIIY